jgi:hypothetical protein
VRDLRDAGCSKIDSIVVLRDVLRISLAEAQMIVHLSPVWRHAREQDEALQDALWATIESMDTVGEGRSSRTTSLIARMSEAIRVHGDGA